MGEEGSRTIAGVAALPCAFHGGSSGEAGRAPAASLQTGDVGVALGWVRWVPKKESCGSAARKAFLPKETRGCAWLTSLREVLPWSSGLVQCSRSVIRAWALHEALLERAKRKGERAEKDARDFLSVGFWCG